MIGTDGRDVLTGTASEDVIVGLGGRDVILGGGGKDRICGGENPKQFGAEGLLVREQLYGGEGRDRLHGNAGPDSIKGGPGGDSLSGRYGMDILRGGADGDLVVGDPGDDLLVGGKGRDGLYETLTSSQPKPGADVVRSGPGSDYLRDTRGANVLLGERGSDQLIAGSGRDTLKGGRSPDVLSGGYGDDLIRGGKGRDAVDYLWLYMTNGASTHGNAMRVDLSRGRAIGMGTDHLRRIEIVWSGGGSDTLIGNASANLFFIGTAGEVADHDHVFGRAGVDTITFDSSSLEGYCCSPLSIDLKRGNGSWGGGPFFVSSIENVIASGDDDRLAGDAKRNRLIAGTGNDVVRGRRAGDFLGVSDGASGNDTAYGGQGSDTCKADPGDTLIECES
jgi:Ca2+-binding RTX toxin-like protein